MLIESLFRPDTILSIQDTTLTKKGQRFLTSMKFIFQWGLIKINNRKDQYKILIGHYENDSFLIKNKIRRKIVIFFFFYHSIHKIVYVIGNLERLESLYLAVN